MRTYESHRHNYLQEVTYQAHVDMRKKVFVTGGLLALFLILGSHAALAASLDLSSNEVAVIKSEIASGKPIKDVLEEHHITMAQIRSALGAVVNEQGRHKLSNTQIATIATKLGLDADLVQKEIASGKTLQQILGDHSITEEQLRAAFGAKAPTDRARKGISAKYRSADRRAAL